MNTMKKILAALALTTAMASPAMALTIQGGSVNVGSLDTVIGVRTTGTSSPADETAWVNSVLNSTSYSVTSNIVGTNILYRTNASGAASYAFNLQGLGTATNLINYVLVKNSTTSLLLRNNASMDWAVFNWADSVQIGNDECDTSYDLNGNGSNSGQLSISHFAVVYTPSTRPPTSPVNVPEPASLGLMGFGLLAAGLRRKRKAA